MSGSCTEVFVNDLTAGEMDDSGNFTGMIGRLQAMQGEFAVSGVRPDSLPYAAVAIGPPLTASDVFISSRRSFETVDVQLFNAMLASMDETARMFAVRIAFVICTLLAALTYFENDPTSDMYNVQTAVRDYLHAVWNIFGVLVDQEDCPCRRPCKRILWLFTAITVFIAVFGYVVNLMSVDKVAVRQLPVVNKLEHFVDQHGRWANHLPYMAKDLFFYPYLKNCAHGPLGKLRARVDKFADQSLISFNGDMMHLMVPVTRAIEQFLDDKSVLVFEKSVMKYMMKFVFCAVKPDYGKLLHESRESFAQGMVSPFHRNRIDRALVRRFEYNIRSGFEAHLTAAQSRDAMPKVLNLFTLSYDFNTIKCVHEEREHNISNVSGLDFAVYRTLYICTFAMLGISVLLLIAEFACSHSKQWRAKMCKQYAKRARKRKRKKL